MTDRGRSWYAVVGNTVYLAAAVVGDEGGDAQKAAAAVKGVV